MSRLAAALDSLRGIELERPALGIAVAAAALLLLALSLRRAVPALAWPALDEARAAGARRFDPLRALALVLRGAALVALAAVLARPGASPAERAEQVRGLDLVLVLDASGSMRALDAQVAGTWRTRLELAREVVSRFALHRVAEGDRVGLVVFGDTALTLCPLTSDGVLLAAALDRVTQGIAGDSTALGDALALAVKRVAPGLASGAAGAQRPAASGDGPVLAEAGIGPRAGRLVVLLTDGRANAGSVPVDVAAGIAAVTQTRVHTVGIGSEGEVAVLSPSGRRELRLERHDLDSATLAAIAQTSGGRYFHARSSADLAAVYEAIDALERVERPAPPRVSHEPRNEPFLAAAGLLLALEIASTRIVARRLP
jgi:Ca-activated chloride channel family protein